MQQDQLVALLNTFSTTTDNAARSSIEATFEEGWTKQPVQMIQALQACIGSPLPVQIQSLAAVLLRRGISRAVPDPKDAEKKKQTCLFVSLPPNEQQAIVQGLLNVLTNSNNLSADLANRVVDVVSEAIRVSLDSGEHKQAEWPQVLNFVAAAISRSDRPDLVLVALRLVDGAPDLIPSHRDMAGMLQHVLTRPNSTLTVTSAAVKTLMTMVETCDDDDKKAYAECVKAACAPRTLQQLRESDDEDAVEDYLSALIDGTIEVPKMFKAVYGEVYAASLAIAGDSDAEFGVRSLAIELALCLVEQLPSLFKKRSDLIQSGLTVILQMICQVDDSQDWYQAAGPDEDDEIDEVGILGEQSLDRFSIALTGRHVAEPLFGMLHGMLQSSEWRHQYGGLKAIASATEGCMDVLEDRLEQLLHLVLPMFAKSHGRVQYAACHALGQLCTDFDGAIQKHYTPQSLEALVGVLARSDQVRVQQHAAAALVNFAEGVDAGQLSPFLDGILSRLVQLLSSSNKPALQQQLIATIAAFSSAAEGLFAKYLPTLMPLLKDCCFASEDRILQCRAAEAMSIFAVAVGKEAFFANPNGPAFMDFLKQQQQQSVIAGQSDAADIADYLQSAWVRMCQVLGDDFAPYLQVCLPQMIQQAQAEADVAILDADDNTDAYDEDEWDFAEVNGRHYGIHTAVLEEKCQALENIAAIAGTMKGAFYPFARDCLQSLAVPMLDFELHDGVQSAAADLSAVCVKSILAVDPATGSQLAAECIGKLMETAKSKYSADYSSAAIDAVSMIIDDDAVKLPSALLEDAVARLEKICRFAAKRVVDSFNQSGDDADDEDQQNDVEEDGEVVYAVARVYAVLCKRHAASIGRLQDGLFKFALEQFEKNRRRPACLQHAALCMLVDAVHWMGGSAGVQAHGQLVMSILSANINNQDDRDIRQAAIYGVGMAAQAFEPFCVQAMLPFLVELVAAPKTPSTAAIHDNAVSAVIKILKGCPSVGPAKAKEIADVVLQKGFPVVNDTAEFADCYGFLSSMLEQSTYPYESVLESLLEACIGSVSKHIQDDLKVSLKARIPAVLAAVGPQRSQPITARFNMSLL